MNAMMTVEEVASKLNISKKTVYEWSKKGNLPSYLLGQGLRFDRQEIEDWIQNNKRTKEND